MNNQVNPGENSDELEKLRRFFRAVGQLTLNHDVLGNSAVVYPRKLGPLLEEIDPKWYLKAGNDDDETKG